MKVHILPGDSLTEKFKETKIEGKIVVCRECFIDGNLQAASLDDFWRVRAKFIKETYGESDESYFETVAAEFCKLETLADGSQINLWFEYELFCQANMWFCLWLLRDKNFEFYRVAPVVRDENDLWKGFSDLSPDDLKKCYKRRLKFTKDDIQFGKELWSAFSGRDFENMKLLSERKSDCFPYLKKVCEAAAEMKSRPKKTLEKIISDGEKDFAKIFKKFIEREGVYGFGDAQVKRILQELY